MELSPSNPYAELLERITATYTAGRGQAAQAVNAHLIETYWQVGRHIVEFEQAGKAKAEYGAALISNLARDLSLRDGRGFSLVRSRVTLRVGVVAGTTPTCVTQSPAPLNHAGDSVEVT